MHSPMEQFEIKRLLHLNLFGIDASFTNSSTWMIIAVILATASGQATIPLVTPGGILRVRSNGAPGIVDAGDEAQNEPRHQ